MFLGGIHNCRNWIHLGFDWTMKPVISSLNSKYIQDQISQIFHFLQSTIIINFDTSIKGSSTRKKQPPLSSNKLPGYTYQRETQDWSTIPPPLQKPTQKCSRIRSYFKCYKSTSILQIETSFSTYKIALNNHNVLGPCLIDSGQCEKLSKRTSMIFELYVESITNVSWQSEANKVVRYIH